MQIWLICAFAAAATDGWSAVDTRLGTGGFGFGVGGINPGVQVPFGAMRLGPDTSLAATESVPFNAGTHYGGYWYEDTHVRAFSHTHLVGAGVGDWGNIGVMPLWTDTYPTTTDIEKAIATHGAQFSHDDEVARPGQYAVTLRPTLLAPPIVAELAAAGSHSGLHRYTWTAGARAGFTPVLLLDVCHSAEPTKAAAGNSACKAASVAITPLSDGGLRIAGTVLQSGSLTGRAAQNGVAVHFSATLDATECKLLEWGVWSGNETRWGDAALAVNTTSGALGLFAVCTPVAAESATCATLRVGISFVSAAQAALNVAAQAPETLSFGALQNRTIAQWRGELGGRVSFSAALGEKAEAQLYGALYRALLAPTTYTEEGGAYRGFDGALHYMNETDDERSAAASGSGGAPQLMSDMSLWDVHRSQLPLLRVVRPAVSRDVVLSLLAMARHSGGDIPRWPLANIFTGCMIGAHGWNVIADACVKRTAGLGPATFGPALRSMAATVEGRSAHGTQRSDNAGYESRGWVAAEADAHSASLTLAYAFDDWSAAQLAQCMADRFPAHFAANATWAKARRAASKRWANLWSAERELLCPREAGGALQCPTPLAAATPYPFERRYVEGDANQYLWFVPGDPEGLLARFANASRFVAKLDALFTDGERWKLPNTLPNPAYWAGNEPDILAPWLFTVAGEAQLTQRWTRWVLSHRYSSAPDGLPGNDDFGTLSAWLVWASIGLYPQAGSTRYFLGSPSVGHTCVRSSASAPSLDGVAAAAACDVLEIVAHNASSANVYVQRAALGGVALRQPFVDDADVMRSGKVLEFWMGPAVAPGGGYS